LVSEDKDLGVFRTAVGTVGTHELQLTADELVEDAATASSLARHQCRSRRVGQ
jgi:hypothetical protein